MTDEQPPPKAPKITDKGHRAREEKQERLARALRENLRRRKAQARSRDSAGRKPEPDGC